VRYGPVLTLVIDASRGRGTIKLSGSTHELNRVQRFFIERFFTRWMTLQDLRRYPEFKRDAPLYKLPLLIPPEVDNFFAEEMARRTILLDAQLASGSRFQVLVKPKGETLFRPVLRLVEEYARPDLALREPLDAFVLEERVRETEGATEYSDSFHKLFPRYMHNRLSLEESTRFSRALAVRHLLPALDGQVRTLVEDYVDSYQLLRDPAQAREFTDAVQAAGATLRITDGAKKLARFYELRKSLRVVKNGEGVGDLGRDIADGALKLPLAEQLYKFQEIGVAHLFLTERALLADDMGLGKTVQAIAAALALHRYHAVKRALIVCPASLKLQWQREIERFSGEKALVISGEADERALQYKLLGGNKAPLFAILNYELTYRDIDELKQIPFGLLIIDEAQRIKNYRTKTYAAIKAIPHRYLFALSGTPLENELEELYNIIKLIDENALPSNPLKFRERYCKFDNFGKITGYKNIDEIQRRISSVTLRRTKKDALSELPPIIDQSIWLEFDPEQRAAYDDVKRGVVDTLTWEEWRELDVKNLLVQLARLREICDSLRIHFPDRPPSPKERELMVLLREQVHQREGQAIVFTQWTRMAELIEAELTSEKMPHVYLHGGVEAKDRGQLVDDFQRGKARVFLSTDAGGLGLNLQAANLIVNFDLPFNPAKVEQRISRAHRIGQDEPVVAVNLLMSHSVEENLMRVLKKRQQLFSDVFSKWEEGGRPSQVTLENWLTDSRKLARELLREEG
jgi:SNF2 family DNA or RNA helicase